MIEAIGFFFYFTFYGLIILLTVILFDMFCDMFGIDIRNKFGGDKDDGA